MSPVHELFNAVLSIILIYIIAVVLRRKGILQESHSLTLARLVTDVFLPAIVFTGLASRAVSVHELEPSLIMLSLEVFCVLLAWGISILLGFSRKKQGAVVFCSAFGSSTFLGYSIITQMYPGNSEALAEAVLISEIGVGYPIFILGPVLAAHFGSAESGWKASLSFFKSPVFYALAGGILWGVSGLPGKDNSLTAPLFHLADVLSGALTPVAIITVGLMLKKPSVKSILVPLMVVIAIKLLLKPFLAGTLASALGFQDQWRQILVILAAMPSAVLGAVFLRRYGGDASLASALLLTATILSCATILAVFWLVGA